jgi:hypothetical protein
VTVYPHHARALAAGRIVVLAASFCAASVAIAGPGVDAQAVPSIDAIRVDGSAITIDGVLDESAWTTIPPLPQMTQESPRYGVASEHRTDVRFAYDDAGIYASFDCEADPERIQAPFFSRDQLVASDAVWIEIDPDNDDVSGFTFGVTASGAILDAQLFRDSNEERLWDGVWRFAARIDDSGWTAEIFVPWATVRGPGDGGIVGINAGRWSNIDDEISKIRVAPQGVPARVSMALDWKGIDVERRGRGVEFVPFGSGRFVARRPSDSLDRSFRVLPNAGADLRYAITDQLGLDVAVNPDFGQAEVDPAVLNLSPFEQFFPEKRRFFLEYKEIFETRFQLFYSRRVGNSARPGDADLSERTIGGSQETGSLVALDPFTRIVGSTRVTGELGRGWMLGALTATTAPSGGVEAFSDGSEARVTATPWTQWSVLRLRKMWTGQTHLGGIVTNVTRFGADPDAFTGGIDYEQRIRGRWNHGGQVIATWDGERTGMGGQMSGGYSGTRTRFSLTGETLTPHANFSDAGFMTNNDFAQLSFGADLFNPQPIGRVRRVGAELDTTVGTSYAGLMTRKFAMVTGFIQPQSLWSFRGFFGGHLPEHDLFETRGGIPYLVPFHWWTGVGVDSPENRRVSGSLSANYGEQAGKPGPDVNLSLNWQPVDRIRLGLNGGLSSSFGRPRWVATDGEDRPIFGAGNLITANFTLRGTIGFTPTLSLTSYNQMFHSTAAHTEFFVLSDPATLVSTDAAEWSGVVDQALSSLVSNSILRWEYRPGSFLFVAYTHRTNVPRGGMTVRYRPGDAWANIAASDARREDVFFVKLTRWFGF